MREKVCKTQEKKALVTSSFVPAQADQGFFVAGFAVGPSHKASSVGVRQILSQGTHFTLADQWNQWALPRLPWRLFRHGGPAAELFSKHMGDADADAAGGMSPEHAIRPGGGGGGKNPQEAPSCPVMRTQCFPWPILMRKIHQEMRTEPVS